MFDFLNGLPRIVAACHERGNVVLSNDDHWRAMTGLAAYLRLITDQDETIRVFSDRPESAEAAVEFHIKWRNQAVYKAQRLVAFAGDCKALCKVLQEWPATELAVREEVPLVQALWDFTCLVWPVVDIDTAIDVVRNGLVRALPCKLTLTRLACRVLAHRDMTYGDMQLAHDEAELGAALGEAMQPGPTWRRNDHLLDKGLEPAAAYRYWNGLGLSAEERRRINPQKPSPFTSPDTARKALDEAAQRRSSAK
jgi:hypothetical protein